MKTSLRTKLIVAFLATVLIPLIGTGLYGNWITSQVLEARALDAAQADLRLRAGQIEGYLSNVHKDLLFLSRTDEMIAMLAASASGDAAEEETARSRLAATFAAFAATHPDTFQVRYIDATGQEIVRVDAGADGVEVIPPERLQNKADRYYFTAAMSLGPGEVYTSPVDLNREFGEIQIPYTPTIRYATPLFYEDGTRAGLIILNLYAEPFLRFAQTGEGSEALLFLADSSGWYLTHPDSSRTFGGPADLDTGLSLSSDYPDIWPTAFSDAGGVITSPPSSLWAAVMENLLPLGRLPASPDTGRVLVYQTVTAGGENGPTWLLIRDEPRVNLFSDIWEFRLGAIAILGVAASGAFLMAVLLARQLTQPLRDLTSGVRRLGRGVAGPPIPVRSSDEFGELAAAFNDMESALRRSLDRLRLLNQAGHHIAARLDVPAVLEAAGQAVQRLFPVSYVSISPPGSRPYTLGDPAWEAHRQTEAVQAVLRTATGRGNWRSVGLLPESGPAGYLCCAPLCVRGEFGLIELYGPSPELGAPTSGNLLSTLAVQISIALENASLYHQLAERRAELQALVEQLINAQEEERRIVAYDIHDSLIQMLVGARLQLRNFMADRTRDPERAEKALQKGLNELGAAITEARRVIEGLRLATLDDLGLATTLRQYVGEVCSEWGVKLEIVVEPPILNLPPPVETAIFRIAQEAITNARKYSGTARLRVTLRHSDGTLTLEVRDWGKGFRVETMREGRGVGLTSMRERARLLGGECYIESTPGMGTSVRAVVPVPVQEGMR